ncbi:MAG: hypothetical protein HC802_00930 [Caldilineaceae bacterium]|nr:hypothetical protein [Caldilineaceae bacterium]
MLRKIFAVLLILVAGVGLLLCLGGLVGAWVANPPLTTAITAALEASGDVLLFADQSSQAGEQQLAAIRQRVDELGARVENATPETRAEVASSVAEAIEQELGPLVSSVRATLSGLHTGVIALNRSLESANRIPGVHVPTLTDELQAIDQRIEGVESRLTELVAAARDVNVDGSALLALTSSISSDLALVEADLGEWQAQFEALRTSVTATASVVPGLIDWGSVFLSLLFILFGAGQVSLILRGVALFQTA